MNIKDNTYIYIYMYIYIIQFNVSIKEVVSLNKGHDSRYNKREEKNTCEHSRS